MEKEPHTLGQRTPLDEVRASLLYLKSLGLEGVECTDEAAALLGTMGQVAPRQKPRPVTATPEKMVRRVKAQGGEGRPLPPRPAVTKISAEASPPPSGGSPARPENRPLVSEGRCQPPMRPVADSLESIRADMGECTRCGLFREREKIVFGAGNPKARLMLIGDMPLSEEGRQGIPFLGASGELLGKMLKAMGLSRDDVYLANILKCCPSDPRQRLDMTLCLSFLERQIAVVRPEVICTLGAVAARILLNMGSGIAGIRGEFQNYRGRRLMPTYHPSFLLLHPEHKRQAWQDLQQVMAVLNLGKGLSS